MLFCGDHTLINHLNPDTKIFNLNSPLEGYEQLKLVPYYQISFDTNDERSFDINYANYVLSNPSTFNELMKVMMILYEGLDVYILIYRDGDYFEMLAESLLKLIQQRYGYNYHMLGIPEDLEHALSCDPNDDYFTTYGLFNLDNDKELYIRNKLLEASKYGPITTIPEGLLY